jgi:putative FmdB family regulatory protein
MPIYEYECSRCGNIVEALQRFSDKPLSKCSQCSGKLHRLISQSSFHLKGSGWYVTDYAGKTNKPAAKPKSAETKTVDSGPPADKSANPKSTES